MNYTHIFKHYICSTFLLAVTVLSSFAQAQTTGNVYSSVITPQEQAFEYRAAFVPASGTTDSRFGNRLHYQRAFRDNKRWRAILQGSDTRSGDLQFDFLQTELLWQFRHNRSDGWDSALRFDARISDSNLADHIGLNWSSQWNFNQRWQARFLILTARQLGGNAHSGVSIEIRERISYRLQNGKNLALEMFNVYGHTTGFGDFETQHHRLGPNFSGRLSGDWSFSLGVLFGLSDAASDVDVRAALIKSF